MDKKIYLDCGSGISGDMFVAAMLDLGADREALQKALRSIPDKGFRTEITRVKKSGIDCCDFNVILDEEHENHDHDMEYLYGPSPAAHVHGENTEGHPHCHDGEHGHDGHHCHCHGNGEGHGHESHHGHHAHRGLNEINEIISRCDMTEGAREIAYRIFRIIGEAEAKAHDLPVEEVHFHEVGALDSIVDVVSAAVTFDSLGIREVIVPKLSEGTGSVRCQHGVMPIPVPATVNITAAYHIPLQIMDAEGEYVTPTGAAIVAAICTGHALPESFVIHKTGLGAGKRAYTQRSNILRAFVIEGQENSGREEIAKLETDIDDCSGEVLGYTMKRLFEAGAKDVHYAPVFMKKNRPAWELSVICRKEDMEKLEQVIFEETTTIGIREMPVMRSILERKEKEVDTAYGKAMVKGVSLGSHVKWYPEYETVKTLAEEKGVPFTDVFDAVKQAAGKE